MDYYIQAFTEPKDLVERLTILAIKDLFTVLRGTDFHIWRQYLFLSTAQRAGRRIALRNGRERYLESEKDSLRIASSIGLVDHRMCIALDYLWAGYPPRPRQKG
jgi:hypothetical protein